MRIGTWNVEYGVGHDLNRRRLAKMAEHPADIWVITETHGDLDLTASHAFSCTSEPRPLLLAEPRVRGGSTWVTLWSRFPLLHRLAVPNPRRMVAAVIEGPTGPVSVAGVVLPWQFDVGDEPSEPPTASWDEYRQVFRDELPRLLSALNGPHRVVAGDFNTSLTKPYAYGLNAEREMLKNLLKQQSLICHTAEKLYPHPLPRKMRKDGTLIDHVCTSLGKMATVDTWAGEDLSDHPGVVVTIQPLS